MTLVNPQSPTGHFIRRWNYPPDYRLPPRMPAKVLGAIRELEADIAAASPVPGLARELAARCRDFRRIDARYAASKDSVDPAHTYWPEAYLGVIETADWLSFESDGVTRAWARSIFESEMQRMMRGLPSGEGLSQNFQDLLALLEDRLARVARTAYNVAELRRDVWSGEQHSEFRSGMSGAAEQALTNLRDVFEWAREAFAVAPADRLLKMRIIAIEYGPPLMIQLHAKTTMHLHSDSNLQDLIDLRKLQHDRTTRMQPRRLDHKYWSWIYRDNPFDAPRRKFAG